MSEIRMEKVAITTTGSAGSATGSGVSGLIQGFILDIYVDYDGSAPATTDLTIAYTTVGGNILVLTNINTDGLYLPRAKPVDNAGAAIATANDWFAVADTIAVSVAQGDALDPCVTVHIKYLWV